MSEVAGKLATQAGAFMLEPPLGGRGVLLGGVPGVAATSVLVIGMRLEGMYGPFIPSGDEAGLRSGFTVIHREADVFVFDRNIDLLRELDVAFGGRASSVYSSTLAVEQMLPPGDPGIGAGLIH